MRIRKGLLVLILVLVLLITACTPATIPPSCNEAHTDADEDLICDICGERLEVPSCDGDHPDADSDLVCDVCGAELDAASAFLPVLRFAITSDVHVRSTANDYGSKEKLVRFIGSAYEYAEAQKNYDRLDGLFIVGDITQDGKTAEYGIVKDYLDRMVEDETTIGLTMGNHEFHAYGTGDDRFTPANIAKSTERFKTEFGYECEDWHKVVNGYHFISIANDSYETRNYFNEDTLNWLRNEIEAAIAADPTSNKPIFVMNHEGPHSSVRGFTGGDPKLAEVLNDYPRVVDFSGHTHRSILDPQSIWQDGFTAIGTGGLAYLGYNMAGHPTLDNSAVTAYDDDGNHIGGGSNGARTGAMYYIVEVDADNNIRLQIYDLLTESLYGEPIIFKVGADEAEVFTPEREERSVAPIFPSDARVEVVSSDYNAPVISFPMPIAGDLTQYFRIELTRAGESEPTLVLYRLSGMHNAAKNLTSLTAQIRGHKDAGLYSVRVYAVNCWGKESLPVCGEIAVAEKSMTPDILNVTFNSDGTASNGADTLPAVGTPTVVYDEEFGRNVACFDGVSGYRFEGIKDHYANIVHSLSIEAYFRAGDSNSTLAIGSNNNSAGFGLSRTADGRIRFNIRFNNGVGKYLYVSTAENSAPIGEWVHAVVVYDNASGIIIYVNGEQATLFDEDGNELGEVVGCSGRLFDAPEGRAAALVVGADISQSGGIEYGFMGDIAAYNLYSRPLSREDVTELYEAFS